MKKFLLPLAVLSIFAASCKEKEIEEAKPSALEVAETFSIEGAAGTYDIPYTLENAVAGVDLKATAEAEWIYDLTVTGTAIQFTVADNFADARTAVIRLTYGSAISADVTLTQEKFGFEEFAVTFSNITASGVTAQITPQSHKSNYFFEIMSKAGVDSYLALDPNKPGDFAYGDAFYQSDLKFLNESAQAAGSTLEHYLHSLTSMYKMTETGESQSVPYSTLKQNTDYYLVVYGMDHQGNRTTAINLFQFRTLSLNYSDLTFTAKTTNVQQNQASFAITPSDAKSTYYWTYVSQADFDKYSLDFIQSNMISSLLSDAQYSGVTLETFLNVNLDKGTVVRTQGGLMTSTTYHIIVWGMDLQGNPTTEPFDILEFTTKDHSVTDDCQFTVTVTEVQDMDIRVKVEASNPSTRYYIALIDETRCEGYNDSQMVERIINMEADRINSGYYGIGVTWENFSDLHTGTVEKWGRRELSWTFEPEHTYRIYVFGVSGNGKCTTAIKRVDAKTAEAKKSDMTFEVSMASCSWDKATFNITPTNTEDFFLPFLIETSQLETYRYQDGSLMEAEVMAQIKDYYEDEINQNIYRGNKVYTSKWFSDREYSLLVFGYAGSNTTKMYEYRFTSPEIPFDKADVDVTVKYELFRGQDLKALAPDIWSDIDNEDCVMITRMTPVGDAAHWYVGLWPPVENYATSGGRDHLVTLNMSPDSPPGDVVIDQTFWRTRPWWYGSTKNYDWYDSISGTTLPHMPWSLSYFAADASGNFGPWHYELMIPVPVPKGQEEGLYQVGYSEAYDFWTKGTTKAGEKISVFSVSTGKEIIL